MYWEALQLCLQIGDIEAAKDVVDNVEDENYRRSLWLKIANHVVEEKKDVSQ